jgi:hypothetical protein
MLNDRVVIGDGYSFKKDPQNTNRVMAYVPQLQPNGDLIQTPDGSAVMVKAGGVVVGSFGIVKSNPINVHKTYLHNSSEYSSAGYGNDMIKMVAIYLEEYQREGWFPVDNIRIFGTTLE